MAAPCPLALQCPPSLPGPLHGRTVWEWADRMEGQRRVCSAAPQGQTPLLGGLLSPLAWDPHSQGAGPPNTSPWGGCPGGGCGQVPLTRGAEVWAEPGTWLVATVSTTMASVPGDSDSLGPRWKHVALGKLYWWDSSERGRKCCWPWGRACDSLSLKTEGTFGPSRSGGFGFVWWELSLGMSLDRQFEQFCSLNPKIVAETSLGWTLPLL